jgi:hypothetical protein
MTGKVMTNEYEILDIIDNDYWSDKIMQSNLVEKKLYYLHESGKISVKNKYIIISLPYFKVVTIIIQHIPFVYNNQDILNYRNTLSNWNHVNKILLCHDFYVFLCFLLFICKSFAKCLQELCLPCKISGGGRGARVIINVVLLYDT